MAADLPALFAAVRAACSPKSWSLGIELVRADAVEGVRTSGGDVDLYVRAPGRTVAQRVVLHLEDEAWSCDCPSSADACEHVAAATIALKRAREEGRELPRSSRAGGRLRYRFTRRGRALDLARSVIDGDTETPLGGSVDCSSPDGSSRRASSPSLSAVLAGRGDGPEVAPSQADLRIDRVLTARRVRPLPADLIVTLLEPLAEVDELWLDGARVTASAEPIAPRALITPRGRGYRLRIERDPCVREVVVPGVAACSAADGTVCLRPLAATEHTGNELERLPLERDVAPSEAGELMSRIVPELEKHMTVTVEVEELAASGGRERPRVLVEVEQRGAALALLPLLVYGDPPVARVDGDRLVALGRGAVPRRDPRAEERLTTRLRQALDLAPGRRVEAIAEDAVALAGKLRALSASGDVGVHGDAHDRLYPAALAPEIALGDGFAVRFRAPQGGEADTGELLRRWREGASAVPLSDGGWAPLPLDWLERYGHQLLELYAARSERGLAPHALPLLAALCDELHAPRPADFAKLAPLLDGFEAIPRATLPPDLRADLREYQRRGVDWLAFLQSAELGGLLADDMGLGKTLQALCVVRGRTLIVCPTSVVHNWIAEIARFRPALRVSLYHGSDRALDPAADVVVTSYALLRRDAERLASERWDAVVLDEAQAIKNPDSQVARAAYALAAPFRLALSGTPVENRLEELWSAMHFASPGLLGARDDFRDRYERPIAEGRAGAAERLRRRIRPFLLRRTKREVLPELPPRTEALLLCELDERERAVYESVRLATRDEVLRELAAGGSVLRALEALLRLRQAACHSGLVPGQHADGSAKIDRLMLALEQAAADGHKALVFSQWTSLLDRVEPELSQRDIAFTRLDGTTRDRAGVVASFQSSAGPPVMLLSLKAGGTGLNLTAADHVFLLDPWWNPAAEDQAADRAHRIGQDRPVMIYRLVAKDTVEERILELQEKKRALAAAALAEGGAAASIGREDLLALLA